MVTQIGKAPPSPEMTLSGLTDSGLSGRMMTAIYSSSPALPDVRPAPQAGCFVSRLYASYESRIACDSLALRTFAVAPSSMSARYHASAVSGGGSMSGSIKCHSAAVSRRLRAEAKGSHDRPARIGAGGRSGQSHAVKECDRTFRRTASVRKAGDEVTTFVRSCTGVSLEQRSVRPPTRLHAHTSKPVWK